MYKVIFHKYKLILLCYFCIRIVQVAVSALAVVFFQRLIDGINAGIEIKTAILTLTFYGVFQIGNNVICYLWNYPEMILQNGIPQTFRIKALEKISRIDYSEYQDSGIGSLIKMIENGADAGKQIYLGFYISILCGIIPNIAIGLFFIGTYNQKIVGYILIGYVFVFIFSTCLLKYLYKIKSKILVDEELVSNRSLRAMMEFVVFRLNKRYRREIDKISGIADGVVKTKAKMIMIHEMFFALFAVFVAILKLIIIYFGISDVSAGLTTIGIIIALTDFVERVYQPIAQFNVMYVQYKLDRVAFAKFVNFFNRKDDKNLEQGNPVQHVKGNIHFKDVSFDYDGIPILNHINLYIEKGSKIAFVGESGSGKSTMTKLALGLIKAKSGQVFIDGQDITEIKLNDFYSHISYIAQDSPVFDGTIKENIVFDNHITDEEVHRILELVCLKNFVDELPDGIYTNIGEKGTKLSGGERQRLAFARVFFQETKIIILDEPTSAMDSITENIIISNLMNLFEDKTIIMVAHRLQTTKNVDSIYLFQDGKIVESGDFSELLSRKGLFCRLWQKQIS